jgi:hypothetical protein
MNAIYLFATFYLSVPSHPCHNVFPTLDPSNPYINLHPPAFGSPGSRAANPWSRPQLAFLDKARNTLGTNLAMAENLFDFFIASGLLARYYYYNGRRGEGYNQANGSFSCHHVLDGPDLEIAYRRDETGNSLQSPPRIFAPRSRLLPSIDVASTDNSGRSKGTTGFLLEHVHVGSLREFVQRAVYEFPR